MFAIIRFSGKFSVSHSSWLSLCEKTLRNPSFAIQSVLEPFTSLDHCIAQTGTSSPIVATVLEQIWQCCIWMKKRSIDQLLWNPILIHVYFLDQVHRSGELFSHNYHFRDLRLPEILTKREMIHAVYQFATCHVGLLNRLSIVLVIAY